MADVFISYKKERHAHAQRLALILESLGYSVWWDYRLFAGPSFRDQIEVEIDAAKAVVVLWCSSAIRSKFVRSEANRADRANKLIQAYLEQVQAPLGFDEDQGQSLCAWSGGPQSEDVVLLVQALAVITAKAPVPTPTLTQVLSALLPALPRVEPLAEIDGDEADEEQIPTKKPPSLPEDVFFAACDTVEDFAFYVQKFPNGRHAQKAREKIEQLDREWISSLGITDRDWNILPSSRLVEKLGPKAPKAELAPRAKRGSAEAAILLAARLIEAGDMEEAVATLLPFEHRQVPRVDTMLGLCYENGTGIEANAKHGLDLTRRAAHAGQAIARNNLAQSYVHGDLVERNPEEGLRLLLLAAGDGLALAYRNLGLGYRDGLFGHRSKPDAKIWLKKAADEGDLSAQRELEKLNSPANKKP